jgi:hypothetical protein
MEMVRGCNVQPVAILCDNWDPQRRALKTKLEGICKRAEKVSLEMSGGRTGGCQTGGVDL